MNCPHCNTPQREPTYSGFCADCKKPLANPPEQTTEVKTPRTDAAINPLVGTKYIPYVRADFARTLERENAQLRAELEEVRKDKRRMDYLETMVVNVRIPLRSGSRNLFWASPEEDEGDEKPSDLRAAIDAAALERKGAQGK